jgi:phospholipid-binding lipoprotein MlaA
MRMCRKKNVAVRSASTFVFLLFLGAALLVAPVAADAVEPADSGPVAETDSAPAGSKAVAQAPQAATTPAPSDELGNVTEEEAAQEPVETGRIADPLESVNRFFFKVNDKLYFWVLRPAARGYGKAVPEDFRVLFSNFYKNVTAPIRIVNKLLQLKPKQAGIEFTRLAINSTIGVGGLRDCAGDCFGIRPYDADFGQTLGYYGVGQGFFIMWPLLGPSTARETVGYGFDWLLYPATWLVSTPVSAGVRAHDRVNSLSFHVGDYEALKKAAVDPYLAVRNAYIQNRAAFVDEAKKGNGAGSRRSRAGEQAEVNENQP